MKTRDDMDGGDGLDERIPEESCTSGCSRRYWRMGKLQSFKFRNPTPAASSASRPKKKGEG